MKEDETHEKWLKDKRYHSRDKGCLVVEKRREKVAQNHYLHIYHCLVCDAGECSRSGWEWGWYGGTPNNAETLLVT